MTEAHDSPRRPAWFIIPAVLLLALSALLTATPAESKARSSKTDKVKSQASVDLIEAQPNQPKQRVGRSRYAEREHGR